MKVAKGKNYREIKMQESDGECDMILLYADFERGYVRTNCGDFYYDYEISFEDFIKFAKFIKRNRRKLWQMSKT